MSAIREKIAWSLAAALALLVLATLTGVIEAGGLDPTDPPASTMKTLQEVEPRTPISAAGTTIATAGSYYLTGDINASSGQNGITITTAEVTIDLNGFTVRGVPGSLTGISSSSARITVRNGFVKGFGGDGISLGQFAVVEGVTASNNGDDGMIVDAFSRFSDCFSLLNGGDGIQAQASGSVSRCSSLGNVGIGFNVTVTSIVEDCVAEQNGTGIQAQDSSIIRNCIVSLNNGDGILVTNHVYVTGNTARGNGAAGTAAGIHATGAGNYIERNTVAINDYGIDVDVASNVIIQNTARANTDNFGQVVAGNTLGVPVSAGNVATNDNPHANYTP